MIKKLLLFWALLTCSCQQEEENLSKNFFDIKGAFSNQIALLTKETPTFIKTVEINSEKETKEISKIDWGKEFDPFIQSDINKSALIGLYDIVESDSTISYKLKKGQKAAITAILIKKIDGLISKIDIQSSDENMLYYWKKHLEANFEKEVLTKYSIEGKQKIMIFEEENFSIMAQKKKY